MTETQPRRKTRSGGRAGAKTRRGSAVIEQMPWNPPVNIDRPTEPLEKEIKKRGVESGKGEEKVIKEGDKT